MNPQDQFNPLFTDDPEFFEHERPPAPGGYFAPPSPLPDHYAPELEPTETDEIPERGPAEFSIPEGASENPQTNFEPTEVPEGSTVDLGGTPPVLHDDPVSFGDPVRPEEHTIEPPEREDAFNSAAQYGPIGEDEVAPERPTWDPFPADHTTEAQGYELPEIESPFDVPAVHEFPVDEPENYDMQLTESENVFAGPPHPTNMHTYSPTWM